MSEPRLEARVAFGWSFGEALTGGRSRGPTVQILRGWDALDVLAPDWARLFAEQDHPAPCVSHAAFRALRRVAAGELDPLFLVLVCGDSVGAIFPLEERRFPAALVLRPLGLGRLPRHEPLLGELGRRLNAGLVLRSAALRAGPRILFDLRGLRADSPGCRWILDGIEDRGAWRSLPGDPETTLNLRGSWPRVEVSLALSTRRRVEDGRRRAARSGGIWVEGSRPEGPTALAPLIELARRSRCHVDAPFLEAFAEEASVHGRLRVVELRQRSRLVAGALVWIGGRQAVELLTCADARLEGLHLNEQVRFELIRHLAEREVVDRLLLAPGVRVAAGPPSSRQARLIGAPASGFGQLVAGSVARLVDDRFEPGRTVARWRARHRPAPPDSEGVREESESEASRPCPC